MDTAFSIVPWVGFYEDVSGDTLPFHSIKKKNFYRLPAERLKPFSPVRPLLVNWLKFSIQNTHHADTLRLIFYCNPHASVQLFQEKSLLEDPPALNALKKTLPDEFALPVIIPPDQTNTYFVRVIEKIQMLTPLTAELFTPGSYSQFAAKEKNESGYLFLFMGMALGSMLFMAVFAGYQYLLGRDTALLYYAAYVCCAFIVGLVIGDQRFDLHIFDAYRNRPHILASSGIAFFYGLFIAHMLELPKHYPVRWKILRVLLFFIAAETTLEAIENFSGRFLFESNFFYQQIIHVPNLVINAYLIWLLLTIKSPLKKYLLAGMLSLFFFLFVVSHFVFSFTDLPRQTAAFVNFPPFWGMLGVVTEAVCFSFALAYRSKLIQAEKNELQTNYMSRLKAELADRSQQIEQQHRLLEEQKISQMETTFEKKLAETEMTALRAQMNPHFIFNCLNSIKLYTLENDAETASAYLTTFSRLIRMVLDNSRLEKIPLEKELETLRLYTELEIMRFKNKVTCEINVAANIDAAFIEIPPLLLQPYVENAIWHGLMHKREGGKVVVSITLRGENMLHVEIMDNGVGREMAAVYKSKSINRHKSYGIKMTSDRLNTINQLYNISTKIVITDLRDINGNACGTCVTIEIPI